MRVGEAHHPFWVCIVGPSPVWVRSVGPRVFTLGYPHPIDPAQRRLFSSRAVALAAAVSSVVNEPIDLVRLSLDERIVVRATRHSPP